MQHFFLNGVGAIKPRAERRAGEMLRERESAQGRRSDFLGLGEEVKDRATLEE